LYVLIKTGSETKLVHISHSISAVFSEQNILRSNQTHECCINIAGENMDELYALESGSYVVQDEYALVKVQKPVKILVIMFSRYLR
jgi:hypothetical protein